MHVHDRSSAVVVEQVLAVRLAPSPAPGRRRAPRPSRTGPAGWTRATGRPTKRRVVQRGEAVEGVAFGHGQPACCRAAGGGGRRCARSRRPCRCAAGGAGRGRTASATNASASAAASSRVCMRAPMATTWASLCWRPSCAVSMLQASAQRMPGTLFAAICSPLPEPPITMPRLPGSSRTACAAATQYGRVVVGGVVGRRPDVDRLVAQTGEVGDQVGLELEAGVVGAEVDAHDRSSCTIARLPIAGVDGVPGGWVVARVAGGRVSWSVVALGRRRAGDDRRLRGGRRRHPARPARRGGAAGPATSRAHAGWAARGRRCSPPHRGRCSPPGPPRRRSPWPAG